MATVEITPEALEQWRALPKAFRGRVMKHVKRLVNWPDVSGMKALSGDLAGWYRGRVGEYRYRFRVEGETVTVDKIGLRKDFYED